MQVEDRLATLENRIVKRLGIKKQLEAEAFDPATRGETTASQARTYDSAADVVTKVCQDPS